MLAKLTSEMLAAVGAKTAAEFTEKFSAFVADSKLMAENQVTPEMLQQSIAALETKMRGEIKAVDTKVLTEAQVDQRIDAKTAPHLPVTAEAITKWSASAEGKKIIGAESSRICMESLASVGTIVAKPAPVGATDTSATAKGLITEGKFEEAWALDKNLQAEFPTAKVFAAYAKAEALGRVSINQPK